MKILDKTGKEVVVLDLGMVKVGEKQDYEYTLENDTQYDNIDIELKVQPVENSSTEDSSKDKNIETGQIQEITVKEYPDKLDAYERGPIKFSWKPSVEIKSGLRTQLKIKALEVWR